MAIITEIRRKLPLRPHRQEENEQSESKTNEIHQICVDDIIPNRSQPRSAFNQNAIARLADSIRRYGILQPLTVRKVMLPLTASVKNAPAARPTVIYELVAGERRLRAAKLAELKEVPCIIINTDDATSAELAIIENLLRENLNMFEQAEAFARLISEFHLTQEEAARRVSMSQSAVANKLRILRLSPQEREKILSAGLTERHARALLKLEDPILRGEVLQHILDRKMNVSASETYIDQIVCELSRYQYKHGQNDKNEASEPTQSSEIDLSDTLPNEIQRVLTQRKTRFKGSIKDLQLFYNSVRHAVNILESAGIVGDIQKSEGENQVVLTITLSKSDHIC
ncbi:MAG: ParB/RepB/Spo0J family partition protein [Clostridia bacterium]|nr:ParB/RepB/Spo0J family partition protein [Clostridia bacterium]